MFLTILLSRGHKLRTVIGRTWVQRSVWHLCHLPPKQKPLKAVPQRLHHFQFRHHNNIIRTNSQSLSFTLSFKNPVEFPQSFVMKTERMLYAPVQIHRDLAPVFEYEISFLQKEPVVDTRNLVNHVSDLRFQVNQGIDLIVNLLFLLDDLHNGLTSYFSPLSKNACICLTFAIQSIREG